MLSFHQLYRVQQLIPKAAFLFEIHSLQHHDTLQHSVLPFSSSSEGN